MLQTVKAWVGDHLFGDLSKVVEKKSRLVMLFMGLTLP